MSHHSRRGFLLAALASAVFSAQAAPTQYDLLEIYNLALVNDTHLAAARAGMQATQETVIQSRANLLPTLGATANVQYNRTTTDYTGGADSKDNYNSNGWGATLNQALFNLNSWHTYKQAQHSGNQASTEFANAEQQLILNVAQAYFTVLQSEDTLLTNKAQERALKQQLDQALERFNVGLIAQTDVLDALAAYDNARVARIQAENQVSVSYENLRTIVNLEVTSIAHLEKEMPVAAPIPNDPEEWVNTALSTNLSLRAARQGLAASESQVKAAKSNHAPTVNAFASYNYTSNNSAANQERRNSQDFPANGDDNQAAIGVKLDLPLYSGGSVSSASRQAGYLLQQAQQNYDQLLRTTNANTRNLFRTANSDVDRIEAGCQVILSSESALKATQSGYEVGTRNITDVLTAQQQLYSSIGSYLNTRYEFILDTLKLKQAAGTLSPADLEQLNKWMTTGTDELSVPTSCRAS